jgi:hypothetical protein
MHGAFTPHEQRFNRAYTLDTCVHLPNVIWMQWTASAANRTSSRRMASMVAERIGGAAQLEVRSE